MTRRFSLFLMALVALATAARPAAAQTYRVTDLGSLSGASGSTASKVNDKGSVLGRSSFKSAYGGTTNKHWLWTPDVDNGTTGRMAEFMPLAGFGGATAWDINNAGLMVGNSHVSEFTEMGWLSTTSRPTRP
jgi:uncharacterized membrane protein